MNDSNRRIVRHLIAGHGMPRDVLGFRARELVTDQLEAVPEVAAIGPEVDRLVRQGRLADAVALAARVDEYQTDDMWTAALEELHRERHAQESAGQAERLDGEGRGAAEVYEQVQRALRELAR